MANKWGDDFDVVEVSEIKNIETISDDKEVKVVEKKEEPSDELSKLKKELENTIKQRDDTKKWGHQQRIAFVAAKKKAKDAVSKLSEDGILYEDEHKQHLLDIFENLSEEESEPTEDAAPVDGFSKTVSNLNNTLEQFKTFSDDKDVDLKYKSYFKSLELMLPETLEKDKSYLMEEDPKIALKFILDKGEKHYNLLYKNILKDGDPFKYIEGIVKKNEQYEKRIKELENELDSTEGEVHNKPIGRSGNFNSITKKATNKWGSAFD